MAGYQICGYTTETALPKASGLLPAQNMAQPNGNFEPIGVPNEYDYGSNEDCMVVDPLSDNFLNLWNSRARQNTAAFGKAFHPVPHDNVRTWKDYDNFYENFFKKSEKGADGKEVRQLPVKIRVGSCCRRELLSWSAGCCRVERPAQYYQGNIGRDAFAVLDQRRHREGGCQSECIHRRGLYVMPDKIDT